MMNDDLPILRPIPRRKFEPTPTSTQSSSPPTLVRETSDLSYLDLRSNEDTPPSRTRSILNLTASTLVGIYSPSSGGVSREDHPTPWGTGAQTPARRRSIDESQPPVIGTYAHLQQHRPQHHLGFRNFFVPLALRTLVLFAFGAAYGVMISHLHDKQQLAPVKVEGIDRYTWRYLIIWGVVGVGLGSLLPWVDILWNETLGHDGGSDMTSTMQGPSRSGETGSDGDDQSALQSRSGLAADWNPAVRSIGALVGIAFAIVSPPGRL
ncbi:Insulin-induced protein family [Lasallia pustulata]|uniref:Insulin-induced protein family n=1 Tax=Lasallia pustulata TaxID=136370 RepID=A0A1W5D1N6_9LECA|nr:Insulin-induced protein family [Lasallia pustulata]